MKILFAALCGLIILAFSNRTLAQALGTIDQVGEVQTIVDEPTRPAVSTPALTLDEIERIAAVENPELHVGARKVAMAEAHVPTTGKLDDPQFMIPAPTPSA
jgi:hypothetical protein